MQRLYEPLALRNAPIVFVSRESAELAKYAANAFLAMKITFINEIADLCEAVGADVQEVATAIGADGRIGEKFLHAGPGYGGSCFPKDVTALIRTAREAKAPLSLIEQVEKVNTERKIAMAGRIEAAAGGSVRDKTIGVLGVTFKPNTDDMREAPSLVILPMLQRERGAHRARLRSARAQAGRAAAARRRMVRQRAGGGRGRRRRRGADRMERVPRARSAHAARSGCAAMCWSTCAMSSARTMPSNAASSIRASAGRARLRPDAAGWLSTFAAVHSRACLPSIAAHLNFALRNDYGKLRFA